LFEETETQRLRTRWVDIQGGFADEPSRAVQEAAALVTDVMKLSEMFGMSALA
jgi:hypothetical protein